METDRQLILAAKANDPVRVRELIAAGGNVNAKDAIQDSAFLYAGAVNTLIRRGLLDRQPEKPFAQTTRALGLRIDVSNTAEALEILEGIEAR